MLSTPVVVLIILGLSSIFAFVAICFAKSQDQKETQLKED